jgi:hypothetical protein
VGALGSFQTQDEQNQDKEDDERQLFIEAG